MICPCPKCLKCLCIRDDCVTRARYGKCSCGIDLITLQEEVSKWSKETDPGKLLLQASHQINAIINFSPLKREAVNDTIARLIITLTEYCNLIKVNLNYSVKSILLELNKDDKEQFSNDLKILSEKIAKEDKEGVPLLQNDVIKLNAALSQILGVSVAKGYTNYLFTKDGEKQLIKALKAKGYKAYLDYTGYTVSGRTTGGFHPNHLVYAAIHCLALER